MIELEKTLISLDVIEKQFVCDLSKCKGICCIEGDSGAPLEDNEIDFLIDNISKILPYMTEKGRNAVEEHGVYYIDEEHDKVTTLVDNAACAFVTEADGISMCAIEKAYNDKVIDYKKPISCHLYPIRITKYQKFDAINYDEWSICKDACVLGQKLQVKVVDFLKEPLIRKYGEHWYNELVNIRTQLNQEK